MKNDITTLEDVKSLVDKFYATARKDEKIGHLFEEHLADKWEEHHEKLYRFWNTVILRVPDYYGKPVPMHFKLELSKDDFNQWVSVWQEVIDALFEGDNANRAKKYGASMANAFYSKLHKE